MAILLAGASATGCITATNSGVVPVEQGMYLVAVRRPTDQGGYAESQKIARQEAEAFCAKEGKKLVVTSEEVGPYAVDLKFRCG
jgi:hypothetical protein